MKSPFLSAISDQMRMKHYAEKTIKAYILDKTLYSFLPK